MDAARYTYTAEVRGNWTDERTELLKRLWSEGLSASQISRRLGGGSSRNAVIGKVHRLIALGQLAPRIDQFRRYLKTKDKSGDRRKVRNTTMLVPKRYQAPRSPEERALLTGIAAENDIARLTFTDLNDVPEYPKLCRFIVGDPAGKVSADKLYCGLETVPGKPYCPGHFARSYTAPPPKRKAPAYEVVPERQKEPA